VLNWMHVLMIVGCQSNPIDSCPADLEIDCCATDSDCLTYYGDILPYCLNPGSETGTCSECSDDSHCAQDEYCEMEGGFGTCDYL